MHVSKKKSVLLSKSSWLLPSQRLRIWYLQCWVCSVKDFHALRITGATSVIMSCTWKFLPENQLKADHHHLQTKWENWLLKCRVTRKRKAMEEIKNLLRRPTWALSSLWVPTIKTSKASSTGCLARQEEEGQVAHRVLDLDLVQVTTFKTLQWQKISRMLLHSKSP